MQVRGRRHVNHSVTMMETDEMDNEHDNRSCHDFVLLLVLQLAVCCLKSGTRVQVRENFLAV